MSLTIFFDLDGTLTDPKDGITGCIQYALEKVGADVPPADDLVWCIGPPLLESLRLLVGADSAPLALTAYRERFSDVGWAENKPYQGIKNALGRLLDSKASMYVATSKPQVYAQRILDHFGLAPYFIEVFGAELDGTRSDKSELLTYALAKTGTRGESSMVGDRSHDAIGARSNGMNPVGVSYGYGSIDELQSAGVAHIVNRPGELVSYFLG